MRRVGGTRLAVPDWLTEAVPDWLADAVRPKKAPVPWADTIRAVCAIWVPLAAGFITGRSGLVTLPAMGGLFSVMIDTGGPYRARVRRIGTAAVCGGVAGLVVYSTLGLGSIGALRPLVDTALQFIAGAVWALLLITPSWLLAPRAAEQRAVASVYHSFASFLRAIGTPRVTTARGEVTKALNAAYDALLTGRSFSSGRNRADMYLVAILNVSHQMAQAATALRAEEERPPPWVTDTIDRLADAIARGRGGRAVPGTVWDAATRLPRAHPNLITPAGASARRSCGHPRFLGRPGNRRPGASPVLQIPPVTSATPQRWRASSLAVSFCASATPAPDVHFASDTTTSLSVMSYFGRPFPKKSQPMHRLARCQSEVGGAGDTCHPAGGPLVGLGRLS